MQVVRLLGCCVVGAVTARRRLRVLTTNNPTTQQPAFSAGQLALLLGVLLVSRSAIAQVRGSIFGPGAQTLPIALSPLKDQSPGGDGRSLATGFVDIVRDDLQLTGIFRILPRESYIEPVDTSGTTVETINFDNWSVLGALALVKGTVERQADQLVIEARLFDVSQRRQLVGRRYRGSVNDLRRMANRFADEIMMALTGERGPFNSRLVFLSTRDGRFKDVYVMSPDGGDVRRITSANTINLSPSWGPDLETLLVTSYRPRKPELYGIDLTERKWTTVAPSDAPTLNGRWSPDGRLLAVTREDQGNPEIFLVNRDGSVRRRLTQHWAIDVSPSWSPDGQQIAFCSGRSGSPQIYVTSSDGDDLRRVTQSGGYNTAPSWSPKGDRIAYVGRVNGRFQIFTVKLDGTDVRQVTNSAGDNEDPSWSPDGRFLVFSSTRAGRSRLYVADASGTSQVELTHGNGDDTSPAWSRWLD